MILLFSEFPGLVDEAEFEVIDSNSSSIEESWKTLTELGLNWPTEWEL